MKSSRISPFVGLGLGMSMVCAGLACGPGSAGGPGDPPVATTKAATRPISMTPSAMQVALAAQDPARPVAPGDSQRSLSQAIDAHFQRAASQRFYLHLDKPLYQPGESIWFRVWELASPTLAPSGDGHGITAELISPKGSVVLSKRIPVAAGLATNDFELPADVPGGEYLIRVTSDRGGTYERKLIVSQYQPPLLKKKLEFLRKAYGAGDAVSAAVAVHRGTGEALAMTPFIAIVTVDDVEVARLPTLTSADGKATVKFTLPSTIARGDGLLTILVEDGGVTESIQKRIPITMKALDLALFPEGGDLVTGLPGRVYFQAKNLLGKPADLAGRVLDDHGTEVARFTSFHNGMGHFELTPAKGRTYRVVVDQPSGITQRVALPAARAQGCVMQAIDDPSGARDDLRVGLWCTSDRTIAATAVLRDKRLGDAAYDIKAGQPSVVSIPVPVGAQGAVRVTLFSDVLEPLAERLIYRGRGQDLRVTVKPAKPRYSPRDPVALSIETRDLAGRPVAADLSLSVVDDTVLAFADDKSANLIARLYLESEMPGQEIDEPSFYFGTEAKAAAALDLVLGTQGWRRFDWQPVLRPAPIATATATGMEVGGVDDRAFENAAQPAPRLAERPQAPAPAPPMAKPADPARGDKGKELARREPARQMRGEEEKPVVIEGRIAKRDDGPFGGGRGRGGAAAGVANDKIDADWAAVDGEGWAGEDEANQERWAWAAVRQFPAPTYEAKHDGPRTDFRETIYWAPSVKTDAKGLATVQFYLSDAVTSFRATAEGVSAGGLPGRSEAQVQSKLPVSLAVTMPLEVSAGDTIALPVTLMNETDRPQRVKIDARFGKAFKVTGGVPAQLDLAAGQRRSFLASLSVVGDGKLAADGEASISIDAANLKDEVKRTIKVVPLGFPQEVSLSGTLERTARHEVELAGAMAGTIEASVQLYPSPLATMVAGTEAILREPGGCFEQASSSNYPNIMVLGYLEANDAADPELVERTTSMLDRGYKMLTGYESPKKGFEWFGGDPGHEALTAYGLMEFADMSKVYGDVDRGMIDRTRAWLRSRRDGKGGFQRNSRALDSFGSASPEVTDGYITYAMTEAGDKDLGAEVARQKQVARETRDPYLLALAAGTLINVDPSGAPAKDAVARLVELQGKDGAWTGADHSITRSGGDALAIEATSLAILALVEAGSAHSPAARLAIEWLNAHRDGFGNFSSTQATVLALRALGAYTEASRVTTSAGVVRLIVNGRPAGELRFAAGHKDPLVFTDLAAVLRPGKNTLELELDGETALPYSIALGYRTRQPASSDKVAVAISQSLAKTKVPVGEGVKLRVRVENTTDQGQPMTLARVGLPGGLTFQTWQLKELKDKGAIDFFETREREVILYFRSLAPRAVKDVELDLLARVPGTYVAPASRAYLYYTDELKHWAAPTTIEVL